MSSLRIETYKEMLCVRLLSDAGPAGRVRCWASPKQGSKRFNFIMKTIHFAHLGILLNYVLNIYCFGRLID